MKRLFDIVFSGLGLAVLAPLLALIAIAIKIWSPGPVIYWGQRIGLHGKPFRMAKFRSMSVGADRQGSSITTKQDTRVTAIGRILRRTKLDELPQLYNVLIGEMSFVGPRPESPPWVEKYSSDQRRVLEVRPGITDTAQILFRHEEEYLTSDRHYAELMQYKIAEQLAYIDNRSLMCDLTVIMRTLTAILQPAPSDRAMDVYRAIQQEKQAFQATQRSTSN